MEFSTRNYFEMIYRGGEEKERRKGELSVDESESGKFSSESRVTSDKQLMIVVVSVFNEEKLHKSLSWKSLQNALEVCHCEMSRGV